MGVSRSGYYDWVKRKPSGRKAEDVVLLGEIHRIHVQSRGTYGSPRVHRKLRRDGVRVGEKRVARLMRESGLKGRVVTVTQRRPAWKRFQQDGENLRLGLSLPTAPDQQWVADLTYIKVGSDFRHLITIMDLYSRRIVGWSLCYNRTANDVLPLLQRVIARRKPAPGLIFHTDRGIEFMAYAIQDELQKHGLQRSYNRLGHCTDNAHMESFYHSLKAELIRGRYFASEEVLRSALASYINGFYNQERLHSGIDYMSPVEYENSAA